jgi:iron complex outermembrane receptor protein
MLKTRARLAAVVPVFVLLHSAARGDAGTAAADTASESLKQLTLEELSRIEVTSPSKGPEQVFRVPMAIHVISSEDIRRSGVTSIPDALRLAPGVEVAQIDGSKWSVGIRGFGSRLARSVLVLIDGRSVYTTFFAGTYWEVQDTVLDDIERIEVIRGPGGTIWGPNAVNGVINIITKQTKDTQGLLVTATSGDVVQGNMQIRYGGAIGSNAHYRVYVKGFSRGPQYHRDGRDYDDWRSLQSGFRVDWSRGERDRFTFQGDLYKQDTGQRVTVVSYTPPFSRIVERDADLSGGNFQTRWTRSFSGGGDVQMQAYYDRTSRFEANFGEVRDTADFDFLVRQRPRPRHQFSWGGGARSSRGAATEVTSGLTFVPLTRTDYLLTGFAQDEIALVKERLSLTVGTKLLRTNFANFQLEPSARLLWTPTKRHSAWAAVTRAVRTPSRAERDFFLSGYINTAANGTPFFARFNANDNFKTERMNGYELGVRHLVRKNLYFDIASFHNRYDDLFSQEIAGPPFLENSPGQPHLLIPAQFRNGLYGATSGYEVTPEWRPTESWQLKGAYSYATMDLHTKPGSQDLGSAPIVERSSPRHQTVIQSALALGKSVDFDLVYRFVSSLPGVSVPKYSTGDARIGWRVRPGLELSLAGRNLMQPSHIEMANDPGPNVGIRRTAYIQLKWTN